ncbi:MAG: hypothetical protein R6V47_04510 [Candidatus Delongbacteria bacterium]
MNLKYKIVFFLILIFAGSISAKNYYIKQMILADQTGDGKLDTSYQETYVSDSLFIVSDEMSRSYIDEDSFTFYNMSDSSYFKRKFTELDEFMLSSDSQIKDFDLKSTEEKTTVGIWDTEKYKATAKIMGMDMSMDMYIAKETDYPADLLTRHQKKMNKNTKNIMNMIKKISATGGIVVKETAKIGGTTVSEKAVVKITEIDNLDQKQIRRPEGFKKIEQ